MKYTEFVVGRAYSSICCTLLLTCSGAAFGQQSALETIEISSQALANQTSLELNAQQDSSADLRNTITKLPGVDLNSNGPISPIAQYRGLIGQRVAVSIDGGPMIGAGPNAMDSPLSHVSPSPYTYITLYRGIAPVSVAVESLGSALVVGSDLESRLDAEQGFSGQLNVMGSDQGSRRHISAYMDYSFDQGFIGITGFNQQRDDVEDGRGVTLPNSFYDRSGIGLKAAKRWNKHLVDVSVGKIDTKPSGTASLAMDIDYVDATWFRLNYAYQLSNSESWRFSAFGNSNQHGMDNYSQRNVMPAMSRLNEVDALARGYALSWQKSFQSVELTAGLNWDKDSHNSTITNPLSQMLQINNFVDVERNRASGFLELHGIDDNLSYTLGARATRVRGDADRVSHSMSMGNPAIAQLVTNFNQADRAKAHRFVDLSAHLSYGAQQDLQWRLGLGRKNRAPSYTELYVWFPLGISAGLADGFNYLGNLQLEHETANQLDVGFDYQTNALSVSPRVFYQSIDNYIVGDMAPAGPASMISAMMNSNPLLQWHNVDARLWGLDVTAQAKLHRNWHLDINAQWVRAQRKDRDEPLYRVSPASIKTRLCYCADDLDISLVSELVAAQKQVSILQNEKPSAGYGLLHFNAGWQIHAQVKLNVELHNLLDKAYQPHLAGINRISTEQVSIGERRYAQGRALNLGLTFNW